MAFLCLLLGVALSQERIALDSRHLSIGFEAYGFGVWPIRGGFREASAEISFNAKDPARSRLLLTASTSSVSTSSAAAGTQLRSANFLDAKRYPVLVFESTRIEFTSQDRGIVSGNLMLVGVTRPISLTFELLDREVATRAPLRAGRVRATGVVRRSDWGMTALMPAISDEVRLEIVAEVRN
jgi:polyisoprenoid-binding protein YceI